uniref:Putative tetraspanin family integral membrane protein n=1 Tax=Rhipicephalus microplus TaxID=6941 RepID=A0A6M2D9N3_RHIMP
MAPVARCLLLTTNVTLWTVGAALLSGGLVALLRPEWEISRVLLDDDSGRPPAEIAGFYVVSGGMLLLISMLGCGGSCGERYAWMVVYVSLMALVTAALTVYLGLQLNACIKERVRARFVSTYLNTLFTARSTPRIGFSRLNCCTQRR